MSGFAPPSDNIYSVSKAPRNKEQSSSHMFARVRGMYNIHYFQVDSHRLLNSFRGAEQTASFRMSPKVIDISELLLY